MKRTCEIYVTFFSFVRLFIEVEGSNTIETKSKIECTKQQ